MEQEMLREVSDPNTPSERLRALAEQTDAEKDTLRALAQNPNTPRDALLWLGRRFPEELLKNPVFPLWRLEEPGLFSRQPILLKRLLKAPGHLIDFWHEAATHPSITVRTAAARHPEIPQKLLLALLDDSQLTPRLFATANPSLPVEILRALARDEHPWIRVAAARSPNLTPELREALFVDKEDKVRRAVVSRKDSPTKTLFAGSYDPNNLVRRTVAEHPNAPPGALLNLAKDSDYVIVLAVARHPNTPLEALLFLVGREMRHSWKRAVHGLVATHPNVGEKILLRLLKHSSRKVKKIAAKQPRFSEETLRKLAEDTEDQELRYYLARNPSFPLPLLARFAQSHLSGERAAAAHNPSLPEDLLKTLVDDRKRKVRYFVAKHPNTSAEMLARLSGDLCARIRRIAERRLASART